MSILITIIVFIVIFSVLILIHELGHFTMAKRAGVRVEEFGFGLPPRIWGKKKGETLYSINWIPFGGFVRMYGEDSSDAKMARSKRSFVGKPMRARVKIVVAGVVMNFLLAWLLMFVGFTFGMEPLLAPDDVLPAVSDGQIVLESGVKIKNVEDGSLAQQVGIQPNDIIYAVDSREVDMFFLGELKSDPAGVYEIVRDGEVLKYTVSEEQVEALTGDDGLGLEFYDFAPFPRVKFFDLKKHTASYKAGLRAGDVIIAVNGLQVYNVEQYEELTRGLPTLDYEIYRDGLTQNIIVERDQGRQVVVSRVIPDSPAEEAGFLSGDVLVSVNGKDIIDSIELIQFVEEHADETLAYLIERNGQRIFYEVKPEEGKIGVYLSELMSYGVDQGVSIYNVDLLFSVKEINDVKYPWYKAWYKSVEETYRLSKLTVKMFGEFITGLLRDGEVPETVAGPVGIAQMTHMFVQEGIIPLLRFVAILSLSLAVINILPFPALDGGRLLFIIIEFIIGRRIPQQWEAWVHAFGYVLILLLILAVTYSDILRLVGG